MNNEILQPKLISVIVPVYNVEKYIYRCLDSLANQSFDSYDVILVDDGSTDNCSVICDKYAEMYNNFICVHQKNMGLSDARNTGIKVSKGKYLTFVDSDDYVSFDYLETLFSLLNAEKDISIVGVKLGSEDNYLFEDEITNRVYKTYTLKELYSEMLINPYIQSAWGKLFHRSIFENERFISGRIMEDVGSTYLFFKYAEKINYCNAPLYYYYQRNDSIMHRPFTLKDFSASYSFYERLMFFKENYYELYIDYTLQYVVYGAKFYYLLSKNYPNEKSLRKELLNKIKENYNECKNNNKWSLKARIGTIVGVRFPYLFGSLMNKIY